MTQPCTILDDLYRVIASRRGADPEASYTARLMSAGAETCAKKLGEEAVETALAAVRNDRRDLVHEAADLIYHLLVLLAVREVSPGDVFDELRRRRKRSGLEEKASR